MLASSKVNLPLLFTSLITQLKYLVSASAGYVTVAANNKTIVKETPTERITFLVQWDTNMLILLELNVQYDLKNWNLILISCFAIINIDQ
jgi:hypothetical protein